MFIITLQKPLTYLLHCDNVIQVHRGPKIFYVRADVLATTAQRCAIIFGAGLKLRELVGRFLLRI